METIEDIAREMREYGSKPPLRGAWLDLADRLEAAHKREIEDAIASTVKAAAQSASAVYEPHIQSAQVGNAARWRDALTKVKEWMERRIATRGFETSATFPTMLEDIVLPALSAPARNCDLYTVGEALRKYGFPKPWREKEWLDFCEYLTAEAKGETK